MTAGCWRALGLDESRSIDKERHSGIADGIRASHIGVHLGQLDSRTQDLLLLDTF